MKIFSKEKFIEVEGMDEYNWCHPWVDECDGVEVIGNKCLPEGCAYPYLMEDYWCIDSKDYTTPYEEE